MGNLKQWILEEAKGEDVLGVVFGEMGWGDYNSEGVPGYEERERGKVLSWEEASPLLDYDFDDGYGAPSCEAVYAWTPTRVIFVSQYDGSTCPESIPRHPVSCEPVMPGG